MNKTKVLYNNVNVGVVLKIRKKVLRQYSNNNDLRFIIKFLA